MSDQSPRLSLPYIQAAQAQKHVTHNAAIEQLDLLVQLTVVDFDATTPSVSPVEGETWALGTGATGAWVGHDGQIASWRGGGWLYVAPATGWQAYGVTPAQMRIFDGTTWAAAPAPVVNATDMLGINATADTANRLTVAAPATLLNHAGAGHQLKLNKATSTDTATLLYQSNWSGRAEIGLAGNDDFAIKVSNDGATFTQALTIDAATGVVTMPATPQSGSHHIAPYIYRHYLYADKRWIAPSAHTHTISAHQTLGTGAEPNIVADSKGIYVTAGTVIKTLRLRGNFTSSQINDIDLRIYFQTGHVNVDTGTTIATSRTSLGGADAIGFTATWPIMQRVFTLNHTATDDGYLFLAMRPDTASTLTATHFFNCSSAFELTLP